MIVYDTINTYFEGIGVSMNYLDIDGRIPTYKVQDEYSLMEKLPDNMPSKRIIKTKKGLKAIKALIELEQEDNISWYEYLKNRNKKNMNDLALFYRGNKVSFKEMFDRADGIAKSMCQSGLVEGDEIGVCVSNTPELIYIILAANRLGLKVNLFGADYNKDYLSSIIDGVNKKVLFVSDDNYEKISDIIQSKNIENIVVASLTDSLPNNPKLCDEYEPELDSYYRFEDKAKTIIEENDNCMRLSSYIAEGKNYSKQLPNRGNLESDFLITYTSGSTKIGFPKEIIHKNRSLITMGRFHDPELCGNPKIPGLRGLAHIHPDSNTDVITCISDNLMQGWSVALEPEYDPKKALDYIILNKPNYLDITTSFLLEVAKQYLIDKKYHQDGKGRKMPFLLATFAVGEGTQKGEEKFINKFLRESRAGSGVSMKGLKLPFTTLSIGGGDCEHGGIFYTLWKSLYQKLYTPKLGRQEIGMLPVPYVVVTALKKDLNGNYVECSYNEPGIIVANSYTNLSCYKNNPQATNSLIVEDNLGRKWVSCKTYGYIDKVGAVHVKGRIPEKENNIIQTFDIDDVITLDTKNILSSTTVENESKYISTIQFQPFTKMNESKIMESIIQRLVASLSSEIIDSVYLRIIPVRESYPVTGSGKRNIRALEELGLQDTIKLTDLIDKYDNNKEKPKTLVRKKQ